MASAVYFMSICAVHISLTIFQHHSSVLSEHACASEKPSAFRPGDGFLPFRTVE
jgi:hypothetical protein